MSQLLKRLDAFAVGAAHFAMAWRWPIVIVAVILALGVGAVGGSQLQFASNYRVFFSPQNPELQAWEDFQGTYNRNDNILFVIQPKTGDVFSNETLEIIYEFTDRAKFTPYVLRIDSLSNFQHTYGEVYYDEDLDYEEIGLVVEPLVEYQNDPVTGSRIPLTAEQLDEKRAIALGEPLLRDLLVAEDGAATAINVVLQYPERSTNEVPEAAAFARRAMRDAIYATSARDVLCADEAASDQRCQILDLVAEGRTDAEIRDTLGLQGGVAGLLQAVGLADDPIVTALADAKEASPVEVALSGVSMLNNSFQESAIRDMSALIPAMFAIVIVLMLVTVRSATGVAATVLIIMLSIMLAMGAGGLIGYQLTPISASAAVVILTLAVADCVHILLSARRNMRRGLDKREAIAEALRLNFLAVSITSLTTIVGFLALNFSDSPPFRHFGNMTAIGIFAAWMFSMTVLPALMSVLPMRVKKRETDDSVADRAMLGLANFVIARYRSLLVVMGTASLALVAAIPLIEFNDQWVEYFDTRLEVRRDNEFALQHFGLYPIEYSFETGEEYGINDPDFMGTVDRFVDFAESQAGVTHVYAVSDIIKRVNQNLEGNDPDAYYLPDNRDIIGELVFVYTTGLRKGNDLTDRINLDSSATRVTVTLTNVTTAETLAFLDQAEAWLADNVPEEAGFSAMRTDEGLRTQATGPQVMFTFVAERNVQSMIRGTAIAIAAIAVIMIFALRSVSLGLLSFVPNGLPILVTFGSWALLVGHVGFSVAAVASVSLGIVVDDTVHFLTKYRRARTESGDSVEDAIRYAFQTVGVALIVNTVVLAAGFAALAFSTFKLNADLGLMTAMAITFALILDFLLLPALLMLGRGKAQPQSNQGVPNAQSAPAQ